MKKILVIHRYYWPDTPPYSSILAMIVNKWLGDGNRVDVLSSQPSYKKGVRISKLPKIQKQNKSTIYRYNLKHESLNKIIRIFNSIYFSLLIIKKIIFSDYDVIMISTSPPVIGGLVACIASKIKGAKFIYHCMDIHPEIAIISSDLKNKFFYKLLKKLDSYTCSKSDVVVVLSKDMKKSILSRNIKNINCKIINNPSLNTLDGEFLSVEKNQIIDKEKFNILFAGNLGRFQGLDVIIRAMSLLREEQNIVLTLMGEGSAKKNLQRISKSLGANVKLVGHYPIAVAKQAMADSDLGYVSIIPNLYKYAYPSKTVTYLENKCPILASVELNSDLARDIISSRVGIVVPQNNPKLLAEKILEYSNTEKQLRLAIKENCRTKFLNDFESVKILNGWSNLLKELFNE